MMVVCMMERFARDARIGCAISQAKCGHDHQLCSRRLRGPSADIGTIWHAGWSSGCRTTLIGFLPQAEAWPRWIRRCKLAQCPRLPPTTELFTVQHNGLHRFVFMRIFSLGTPSHAIKMFVMNFKCLISLSDGGQD